MSGNLSIMRATWIEGIKGQQQAEEVSGGMTQRRGTDILSEYSPESIIHLSPAGLSNLIYRHRFDFMLSSELMLQQSLVEQTEAHVVVRLFLNTISVSIVIIFT